jgi:hypothetical protein
VSDYGFPQHIWRTVAKEFPQAGDNEVQVEIDHGLRDWFICCAWRRRRKLGMVSRLVDEAWHAFLLDSVSYTEFCRAAYGQYLHHFPDGSTPRTDRALANTVWAWDRSVTGRDHESVMWDLDARHRVKNGWGISEPKLNRLRVAGSYTGDSGGPAMFGWGGDSDGGGGADAGGGCGGGGCGGGGS